MGNKKLNFYKLEVWGLGMEIVHFVYSLTRQFPKEETFGLSSQIKRAAMSVPLNIAEGTGRKTPKDFANFLRNALGSVLEVLTCGEIALQEKFIDQSELKELEEKVEEIFFKLICSQKRIRKREVLPLFSYW